MKNVAIPKSNKIRNRCLIMIREIRVQKSIDKICRKDKKLV